MKAGCFLFLIGFFASFATFAFAQQPPDEDFRFANASPAHARGQGPRVCLDVAHNNFQAPGRNPGAYRPFETLLGDDGYRVQETAAKFTPEMLAQCDLLVIANALGDANVRDWAFPHPSAFSRAELEALHQWIRAGGGLLLIAHHAPAPAAAADLGAMLGVIMVDGYARLGQGPWPDVFSPLGGHLRDHAILRGRSEAERVDRVGSFVGHAFHVSREWSPLARFGPESFAWVDVSFNFSEIPREAWPRFMVPGWAHAAARQLDRGKIVWLGEVSICTALRLGEERRPVGMNHPAADQNAQFCLNIARWLSGVLKD
jgi:hypothetical protein